MNIPTWRIYTDRRILVLTGLGLFCGLPWSLTHTTLTYWLTQEGVSIKMVGLFALASLPYTLKFLWAPLFDKYQLPLLSKFGQKQGWMILSQAGLAICLWVMSQIQPHQALSFLGLLTILASFFAASQDIAVDGWRVEILEDDEQGVGASVATFGYRLGMYVSSAGAILLSAYASWSTIYTLMALFASCALLMSMWSGWIERQYRSLETTSSLDDEHHFTRMNAPTWLITLVVATMILPLLFLMGALFNQDPQNPFDAFGMSIQTWQSIEGSLVNAKGYVKALIGLFMLGVFAFVLLRKKRPSSTLSSNTPQFLKENGALVLCFIATFRLGDHLLSFFLYPSLHELGFSPIEIASVAKTWGLIATFIGTFFGGWLTYKVGLMKAMVIAGFAQMGSNLALSIQSILGHDVFFLYVSIGIQDLALGMVNATFVAYLSSLCDRKSAAGQFAFFTALSSLLKTFLQAGSGWIVAACKVKWGVQYGWAIYFAITSLVAVPGLILMFILNRREQTSLQSQDAESPSI